MQLSGKKGHKIKNVHTKNRLQINLEDGTTIHVGDLHKDQLSEVGTLLMEIQNGKLPDRGEQALLFHCSGRECSFRGCLNMNLLIPPTSV